MLLVLVGNLPKRSKSPSFQKSVGEKFQAITLIFLMFFSYFYQEKWEQDVSLAKKNKSLIFEMQ